MKFQVSPLQARVIPFVVFLILTAGQGWFGEPSRYWMYALKTAVGAGLIWLVWPLVAEMRWRLSWDALAAGVLVAFLWIGLDPYYPKIGVSENSTPWNPHDAFGQNSIMAWSFILIRILGSAIVVPPLEEVFYRSFLYRYLANPDFESVPLRGVRWTPFIVTTLVFGLAHPHQWLAGILCGAIYQTLVCRHGHLGNAITAHAITNALLGLWVAAKGDWHFW